MLPSHDVAELVEVQIEGTIELVHGFAQESSAQEGLIDIVAQVLGIVVGLAAAHDVGVMRTSGSNVGTSQVDIDRSSDLSSVQVVGLAVMVMVAQPVQDDIVFLEAVASVGEGDRSSHIGLQISISSQSEGASSLVDMVNNADEGVLHGHDDLVVNGSGSSLVGSRSDGGLDVDLDLHAAAGVTLDGVIQVINGSNIASAVDPVLDAVIIVAQLVQVSLQRVGIGVVVVVSLSILSRPGLLAIGIGVRPLGHGVAVAVASVGINLQASVVGPHGDVADQHVAVQNEAVVLVDSIGQGDGDSAVLQVNHANPHGVADVDNVVGEGTNNHGSLQSVEHHLSSFLTGDSLLDLVVSSKAVQQAELLSVAHDVDLPVGANVALSLGVEADHAEEHLGSLNAGHLAVGIEGGGIAASNDADLVAVSNVALRPDSVAGHVGKLASRSVQVADVVLASVSQDSDHLGHLSTGNGVGGSVGAIGIAIQDANGGEHIDGFGIANLVSVGVLLGAGSHRDEAKQGSHDEHQSQNFAKVLHESSSL